MIRKTHKDIYLNVSERLGLSYESVELIGNYTWQKFADTISNCEHRDIYMSGLGSFRFRRSRAERYIKSVENIKEQMIKMKRPIEYAEIAKERCDATIAKLKPMIKAWDDLMEEKAKFKERKKEYYVNRDIQEQSSDMGRIEESNI